MPNARIESYRERLRIAEEDRDYHGANNRGGLNDKAIAITSELISRLKAWISLWGG